MQGAILYGTCDEFHLIEIAVILYPLKFYGTI